MRTFILNTINQIPATNRQLDYKSTLKTNEWIVFADSEGEIEKFLFMDDDELLVSVNGKTLSSKWQFMKVNSSLIIDDGINKYMFKIIVCSKDIVFLNVDSTNNYSFLINTKSKALKDASWKDVQWYLMKEYNIDLFDDGERMAYFEAKKEDEKKRQEKIDRKGKNALMWLGGVMVTIICFFLVTRYVEYTEEKRQQKEEYERNHPEMKVTRVENRQAVDLGLSVKWATCDIGANLPTEAGNKYGWGDTTGIIYTGYHYNGEEYIPEDNINEYAYPSRIEKEVPTTIVGSKYDVAKQCWGEKWRMPTRAEAQELIDSCEFVRQDDYIAAIGPSGKSVLFPLFDQWHNEYATGELDTLPIFGVHPNKSIYTFIIAKEYYDGFPTGKLYVKMANSGRASMLRLRAVCEK